MVKESNYYGVFEPFCEEVSRKSLKGTFCAGDGVGYRLNDIHVISDRGLKESGQFPRIK